MLMISPVDVQVDLIGGRLLRLLALLLDLLRGVRLGAPGAASGHDRAGGSTVGGPLAGIVAGDLADQGSGGGTTDRSLDAGTLAGLGDLLLLLLGLLLLLFGLLGQLEGIRAGILDRPAVARRLVLGL
jgi:hypothetical protein